MKEPGEKKFGVPEGEGEEKDLPPAHEICKKEDIKALQRKMEEWTKELLVNNEIVKTISEEMSSVDIEKLPLDSCVVGLEKVNHGLYLIKERLKEMKKGEESSKIPQMRERMKDLTDSGLWLAKSIFAKISLAEGGKMMEKKTKIEEARKEIENACKKKDFESLENSLISCYHLLDDLCKHVINNFYDGDMGEVTQKMAIEEILKKKTLLLRKDQQVEEILLKKFPTDKMSSDIASWFKDSGEER